MNQAQYNEACEFLSNLQMIIRGLDGKATTDELKIIGHYVTLFTTCSEYVVLENMQQYTQNLVKKYNVLGVPKSVYVVYLLNDVHSAYQIMKGKMIMEGISNETTFDVKASKKMLFPEDEQLLKSLFVQINTETDSLKGVELFLELQQKPFFQKYLGGG